MLRSTEELKMVPNLKMITGATEQTLDSLPCPPLYKRLLGKYPCLQKYRVQPLSCVDFAGISPLL